MSEMTVINALKECRVDLVASLPCDRNKALTAALPKHIRTVNLTREEDGVGICAGAYLAGGRPAMSIQSSGIGNMLNAMMSLTSVYKMPLPILASWRGTDDEPIEAQKPFNAPLPKLLDAYGIHYEILNSENDLHRVKDIVNKAYDENRITVALIKPSCWSNTLYETRFGSRSRSSDIVHHRNMSEPVMSRFDAIKVIMDSVRDDDIVVSNIGVPSKEAYAAKDRTLNFYMLGSYTQATPIGLGMAIMSGRRIIVIDGDGSLLGSSVLPVVAAEDPSDLVIVCLDNGTFGSTGDQMTNAYGSVDLEAVARAYGITDTSLVYDKDGISEQIGMKGTGPRFVHVMIRPGNSQSKNIPLSAAEIKERFTGAVRNR
jgi:sulfopyruvate decarboxylase subunit beta